MRRSSLANFSVHKDRSGTLVGGPGNRSGSISVAGFGGFRPSLGGRRRSSLLYSLQNQADNKMWSNACGNSLGLIPGRNYLAPLFLMLVCPTFVMLLHHILAHLDGSLILFWYEIRERSLILIILRQWFNFRTLFVWKIIGIFLIFQLLIMKLLPGKEVKGPMTPAGNTPIYKANGFQCYLFTVTMFCAGVYFGQFSGGLIFDHMAEILSTMNIFSLIFCTFLYFKGLHYPSSTDSGSTGNVIFDFYWGTELHPRIFGWDVKQFTNCRCGMTFWALCILSCTFKQYEMHGTVADSLLINVGLQLIYITKFFIWEEGYLSTVDIAHDRAGFYLCWGVLVWLPCVYTSHSIYLVDNPNELGTLISSVIFVFGLICIYVNYDCDRQRQNFRREQGRKKVWGKDPLFLEAKYRTESGELKTNLLLASGWWGMARHFHYVPEILAAFSWTCPVWCREFLPYFYVGFLLVLLVDRAYRDDARCRSKYGKYWEQYCYHVPHMLIPEII